MFFNISTPNMRHERMAQRYNPGQHNSQRNRFEQAPSVHPSTGLVYKLRPGKAPIVKSNLKAYELAQAELARLKDTQFPTVGRRQVGSTQVGRQVGIHSELGVAVPLSGSGRSMYQKKPWVKFVKKPKNYLYRGFVYTVNSRPYDEKEEFLDDASAERQFIAHAFYDFGDKIKPYQKLDKVYLLCDADDADKLDRVIKRGRGTVFRYRVTKVGDGPNKAHKNVLYTIEENPELPMSEIFPVEIYRNFEKVLDVHVIKLQMAWGHFLKDDEYSKKKYIQFVKENNKEKEQEIRMREKLEDPTYRNKNVVREM